MLYTHWKANYYHHSRQKHTPYIKCICSILDVVVKISYDFEYLKQLLKFLMIQQTENLINCFFTPINIFTYYFQIFNYPQNFNLISFSFLQIVFRR